jgi:hypothetical protein
MTKLTVNIDNSKDLTVVEEILNRFGISYTIEGNDAELDASLQRGFDQSVKGLMKPDSEIMPNIRARFKA